MAVQYLYDQMLSLNGVEIHRKLKKVFILEIQLKQILYMSFSLSPLQCNKLGFPYISNITYFAPVAFLTVSGCLFDMKIKVTIKKATGAFLPGCLFACIPMDVL